MNRFSRAPRGGGPATVACALGLLAAPTAGAAEASERQSPLRAHAGGQGVVRSFANPAPIPIPRLGPSSLYPSTITVSGALGTIFQTEVVLDGLSHTFPDDLDVLLVSPAGTKVILHSDAGGGTDVSNVRYVIYDLPFEIRDIPDEAAITGGGAYYRNRDYDSPPDEVFPAPAPPGPYYVSTSAFKGENPNGTWSLYVRDDKAGDMGSFAGGWSISFGIADAGAPLTINDNAAATPYPHTQHIPLGHRITKLQVVLSGLSHTFPDDLDVFLQGPGGQTVLLMSDAGGETDVAGVTLVFDDAAPAGLPDGSPMVSGTFRPTNFDTTSDTFPVPAPGGPYGASLAVFNNTEPLGTWRLFVRDDVPGDAGNLLDWGLVISTVAKGDFNQSSYADLLWRHDASGENVFWYMNGNALHYGERTDPPVLTDVRWNMVGTHDFNGDSRNDILWRHTTSGEIVVWFMERNALVSGTFASPPTLADVSWQMAGTGDFNGDAKPDILWRHDVSGQNVAWFMNGVTLTGGTFLNPPELADTDWKMVGTGYFDGNNQPDILWWHQASGQLVVWFMDGITLVGGELTAPAGIPDVAWRPVATGDFNFDRREDVVWRNQVTGANLVWYMGGANGTTRVGEAPTDPPVFADTGWKIVGPR
jgi:subtilisin-like proprotein convertase family protein